MTRPPRLAVRLLALRLSAEWSEFVIGDLEEEFAARSAASPAAARIWFWRQALRCLVAPPPRRNVPVHVRGDSAMHSIAADLRHALRVFARAPSFAFAIVAIFALGIGANAATFSIINAVLLRPMPFDQPERIVRVFTRPPQVAGSPQRFAVSGGKFASWQEARSFEAMALYRGRQFTLTGLGSPRALAANVVGAGFFDVINARPALGRVFLPEEDIAGNHRVAILSDRFWRNELGAAADAIGRTLTLNSEPYTIVGVMPASASFSSWSPTANDIWVPLALTPEQRAVRDNHNASSAARLAPGVTVQQAQAEMDALSARLAQAFPKSDTGWGAVVVPIHDEIVGNSRLMLTVTLAAVSLVLLIACANVGNLLLARALSRRKEIAIRSALGAGRRRVFQQLLVEALVLSVSGGALGLVLAYVGLDAISTLIANQVPRADEIAIDARVLLFGTAVSLLTGCLAGTVPAVRAGRSDLNDALKEGGRGGGAMGVGTRRALVVCEVALSVVLLAGAVVVVRNLMALRNADAGFNPSGVLTMNVLLPGPRYPRPEQRTAFYRTALERLRALPGVESVTLVDNVPLVGGSYQALIPEGYPQTRGRENMSVQVRQVSPGYLQTMGIALVRGRDIEENDGEVMLISESAAKLYWGSDDPIGRRAALPFSPSISRQIVGIVGEVRQLSLMSAPLPAAYVYSPSLPAAGTFALRTQVPPMSLSRAAVGVIQALDPQQPVQNIRTMEEVRDRTLGAQRFTSSLFGFFAGLALLLASVGIYSVLSYIVRGRSREMGIRAALGAQAGDIVRLVIVEGLRPALAGIVIGIAAAYGAATFIDRLVVGVSATDPLALALVAGTLTLAALAASLVPAYRASRLDPVKALRAD